MQWLYVPPNPPRLLVACLCAGWCSSCQGLKESFENIAAQLPSSLPVWLDIDDDEALLPDDLDITSFPTLLIAKANGVLLFFGPAEPRLSAFVSLALSSTVADAMQSGRDHHSAQLLAQTLLEKARSF